MLTGHEQRNHHVGDFVIGERSAVLVRRVHQVLHDVQFDILVGVGSSFFDSVHIDLGDCPLSMVALSVPGERGPVEHKVDGSEAHIQIVVESGQRLVKLGTNDTALKTMRGSEDCNFGHLLGDVDDSRLAFESSISLEVGCDLVGDDRDVRAESFGREGNLDELYSRNKVSTADLKATLV